MNAPQAPDPNDATPRGTVFLLLAAVALVVLALARLAPPRARALSASSRSFSASRASATLEKIFGAEKPHPIGSPASDELRERIIAEFDRLRIPSEIQETVACTQRGTCAKVMNVIARLRGQEKTGKAVLLAVHYDSVPAGPGASDDGIGVAVVLEIARALREQGPGRNPVILLIDDGEETGLLGAEAFTADHRWAKDVGAVVNIEARGTSGPSFLFETNEGNGWVIREASRALLRPATSSLFYTIYKQLPNDTDFTVFRRAGMQGVNFGIIGRVQHYHTPRDEIANLSLPSIQHHGDNALAMVRAFRDADLSNPPKGDAVWFDLFNTVIVRWPASWSVAVALTPLLLILFAGVILTRRRVVSVKSVSFGAGWFLTSVVVTIGVALIAAKILERSGAFPDAWVARPGPARVFFVLLPIAVSALFAALFLLRVRWLDLVAGASLVITLLGVLLAVLVPGGSHLLVVPAICCAAAALWYGSGRGDSENATQLFLPLTGAVAVLFPLAWTLYDAMGLQVMPVTAALVALIVPFFVPPMVASASVRHGLLPALGLVTVFALGIAIFREPWSVQSPRRLNLAYLQDDSRDSSQWMASASTGALPETMAALGTWEEIAPFPWSMGSHYFATRTPSLNLPAPIVEVQSDVAEGNGRRVVFVVRSARNAQRATVQIAEGGVIDTVTVDGHRIDGYGKNPSGLTGSWTRVRSMTLGDDGMKVEVQLRSRKPLEVTVTDESFGLPAQGEPLLRSRPEWCVPSDSGDLAIVVTKLTL